MKNNPYVMQGIGTVISTEDTPSTTKFVFTLNTELVRRGQFVQLMCKDGILIGRVEEILKANRYFSRADSVIEYERSGRPLKELFPVERWEYPIAIATPLGVYENGMQKRVSFPPSPGDKVYEVDEKILFHFLGLDKENGLVIGDVEFHNVQAALALNKLFQRHCCILAQTGYGKSYLVSVIIEELLKREADRRPTIIIIDQHGEYVDFAENEKFAGFTKVFDEKNIKIGVSTLSVGRICEFQPFITHVAKRELSKIINKLQQQGKPYDMKKLISEIEKSEINPKTKDPLIGWLEEMDFLGIFGKVDSPSIQDLANVGQLSIFDLSRFIHLNEKQIILTHFLRKAFEARRREVIPPFILIIEEAHNFCPEKEEKARAISKGIIEMIAREGRKFNACVVLVSQRPIQLSTTVLSQCGTHIILHVSNPYDLEHIGKSCEGITNEMLRMIPGLKIGEAIIAGEAVNYPLLVKVRKRESKKYREEIGMEDALIKYNEGLKLKAEDLDAFL